MTDELLKLPWQIQVALGSGYAAYLLSYAGIREHHKAIDTTFISVAFGLVATAALMLTVEWKPIYSLLTALIAACTVGVVWRKWGRHAVRWLLWKFDISWGNNDPSALATLIDDTSFEVSQIAVQLDDGTWLRCDDTTEFNGAPNYPCLIGPAGDVALYVTHEEPIAGRAKRLKHTRDPNYGDLITYIPAVHIKRLNLRRVRPN